jgi:hypothetical protein
MELTKEEYYEFFINKGNKSPILDEKGIKRFDKILYDKIIEFKELHQVKDLDKFSELLLRYLNNIVKDPICKHCNINNTKFKQFSFGYYDYCSTKCSSNSNDKQEDIRNTCLEKYGHINVAHGKGIKEKIEATNLRLYGGNPSKNEKVKEKFKQTCLERFGVDHQWKSTIVQEKIKQTTIKRYGFENALKNKEIKEKVKKTSIENGLWYKWNSKQIENLLYYRKAVAYYSNANYRKYYYQINPDKLKRSRYEYNLDHIYPVIEGWKNNVDPKDISHPNNLQLLWYVDNRSKGIKTDLSLSDFYKLIGDKSKSNGISFDEEF